MDETSAEARVGLTLTGGGARGAYQVGVLVALYEMCAEWGRENPFTVFTGTSAGAINAAFLATQAHKKMESVYLLQKVWEELYTKKIYRGDTFTMLRTGLKWISTLSLGNLGPKALALLDTRPLRELLEREISFQHLEQNIQAGLVHSLAFSMMNYSTGWGQTYYQGHPSLRPWQRVKREGLPARLSVEHIMASSAIPILFPPVKLGNCYYGDGNVRNYTPCGPAINLGAKKLIVIGVKRALADVDDNHLPAPSVARILSVLLNTILLDSLDLDIERLQRINQTLNYVSSDAPIALKKIEFCVIRPSEDIGQVAIEEAKQLPKAIRHLLKGLGSPEEASELMSYLLFVPSFTQRLIQMGYKDARKASAEVEALLFGPSS